MIFLARPNEAPNFEGAGEAFTKSVKPRPPNVRPPIRIISRLSINCMAIDCLRFHVMRLKNNYLDFIKSPCAISRRISVILTARRVVQQMAIRFYSSNYTIEKGNIYDDYFGRPRRNYQRLTNENKLSFCGNVTSGNF